MELEQKMHKLNNVILFNLNKINYVLMKPKQKPKQNQFKFFS